MVDFQIIVTESDQTTSETSPLCSGTSTTSTCDDVIKISPQYFAFGNSKIIVTKSNASVQCSNDDNEIKKHTTIYYNSNLRHRPGQRFLFCFASISLTIVIAVFFYVSPNTIFMYTNKTYLTNNSYLSSEDWLGIVNSSNDNGSNQTGTTILTLAGYGNTVTNQNTSANTNENININIDINKNPNATTSKEHSSFYKNTTSPAVTFVSDFVWGVATSSYQIEGAVHEDGRGSTIWDVFVQQPGTILDNSTGSITDDHYHLWKQDVALMKSLNIKAYRFSIAWSRIVPNGFVDETLPNNGINMAGIQFYNNLIQELVDNNIQPWVTLFHWDLPQVLQETCEGWLDDGGQKCTIDAFANYSRIIYEHYGDRVKHFITLNEPWTFAVNGYSTGIHAPGRKENPAIEPYLVGHNMLLAHAAAYQIYHKEYASKYHGKVGIANSGDYRYAKQHGFSPDEEAAERAMVFQFGWFVDPILSKTNDYPLEMKKRLGQRLPTFTKEEKQALSGSVDFLGLNYYSSLLASYPDRVPQYDGYWADVFVDFSNAPQWEQNDMGWNIVPHGLRDMLLWISDRYNNPLIYITENGTAEKEGDIDSAIHDVKRRKYIEDHVRAGYNAIVQSNHNVKLGGYFAWSFMDNFEWQFGFERRFGICHVDFQTLTRTPKKSALWYKTTITNNGANINAND